MIQTEGLEGRDGGTEAFGGDGKWAATTDCMHSATRVIWTRKQALYQLSAIPTQHQNLLVLWDHFLQHLGASKSHPVQRLRQPVNIYLVWFENEKFGTIYPLKYSCVPRYHQTVWEKMAEMQAWKAEKSKPFKIEFKQSIFKLLQSYLSHQ